ncbi:MAG TPA: c-type cytochrome domain-containing protein [Puia sp.]|uniref:c-type cytochrome domain-containing protein n=1 Tax=Puia sp. TaxID=2045100 RepID=UPI002B7FB8EF|nr:c-type cytochrome domain-containing protein [Puia sp.]HVU98470.1 c-type cytochrome domain-containing protein [Puia sp.]
MTLFLTFIMSHFLTFIMSPFLTFIGHFHPVLVHLPIGLILGALLLQLLASRAAYAALRPAVPVVLLAGAFSGVLSCCTGWILSTSGEYDATLVGWHQWMGIGLTFFCFYVWSRSRVHGFDRTQTILSIGLFLLVVVTGHLGGSLTHGSDYLSLGPSTGGVAEVDSPILDVQRARAYAEIVRPILRDNCYGCHGATRQKGGLRLDDTAALLRGGKDGVVLLPGRGGASEMMKRLLLPVGDEHHMPPKEKKQLPSRDILLLHWWIDQGADFSRRVAELGQPDSVRGALLAVQGARRRNGGGPLGAAGSGAVAAGDVPAGEVEAADERAVEALRAKGVTVMPVARGSHWLEADFEGMAAGVSGGTGVAGRVDEAMRLLLPVKKQLISLRLDHTGLGDSAMAVIGQCDSLRSLDLAGTRIGDAGLAFLKGCAELRVLNLVGTGVRVAGVEGLKGLTKLRTIYLYQTKVSGGDWVALKKVLPKVELDTGGYSLPVLVTDTAVVRPKSRN